ncbi:hypothetical protein FRC00_006538 [Tulasnella sp. 408]|nr:hypothetical protein FRC00_006538 [Tulasnella sp. 408]
MASTYSAQSSGISTDGLHPSASASRRSARLAQSAQSNIAPLTNNTSGITNANLTHASDAIVIDSDSDLEIEAGTQSEEYVPSDAETDADVVSDNEAEVDSDDEIVLPHTTGTTRGSGTDNKAHCSMDCKHHHLRQRFINASLLERVKRLERKQQKSLMDSSFKRSAGVQSDKSAKLTTRLNLG